MRVLVLNCGFALSAYLSHYYNYTYISSDESAGPAYDVQLLTKLMEAYKVPQRLQFLCVNAQEVSDSKFTLW